MCPRLIFWGLKVVFFSFVDNMEIIFLGDQIEYCDQIFLGEIIILKSKDLQNN
jgi:hypothetical protein